MGKKKWLVIGGGVLALGGILSLFEDKPDKTTAEAPKSSASAPAEPAAQASTETPKPPSGIPSLNASQIVLLLKSLNEIDPALIAKDDHAISRSQDTCLDLREGKDPATVQRNTRIRFTGGSVTVTDDQADEIVKAVRAFCS